MTRRVAKDGADCNVYPLKVRTDRREFLGDRAVVANYVHIVRRRHCFTHIGFANLDGYNGASRNLQDLVR